MKSLRLALLSTLLAPLALRAEPSPGAIANVTVTLTESYEEFVSESENGSVSKLVKFAYGNRQLLEDLLREGFLGEETSIKGWRLVVVDRSPLLEQEGSTLIFYLVKNGASPIQIPEDRLRLDADTGVSAEGRTEKFTNGNFASLKTSFKSLVELAGRQTLNPDSAIGPQTVRFS